jgi:phosphatidylglycerol:prolipoprotein diacylglycerol transferase
MPTGFNIWKIHIYYYGIILMFGALAGAWLASTEARRKEQNTDIVWDGFLWVLIGGIIGARLWHILTPPPSMTERGITTLYYLTHPLDAINIRNGGLGIPGAVLGGALALYLFCRRRQIDFRMWVDIAAPGVALGQAIGRWGNFFNQELYGRPSNLPWAIFIDPQYRVPGFENFEYFHPLFLYESLWNLGMMGLLLWLGRRLKDRLLPGDLFLVYLIGYPIGRFFLEFLRLDSSQIAGINANQTLMLLVVIASSGIIFWRHRKLEPEIETIEQGGITEKKSVKGSPASETESDTPPEESPITNGESDEKDTEDRST